MKRSIIICGLVLILTLTLNAQNDCCKELTKQAIEQERLNESGKRTIDSLNTIIKRLQVDNKSLVSSVNKLKNDSIKSLKYQPQIKEIEQLNKENLSIQLLKEQSRINGENVLALLNQVKQLRLDTANLSNYYLQKNQLMSFQDSLEKSNMIIHNLQQSNRNTEAEKLKLQNNLENCLSVISKHYEDSFPNLADSTTIQSLEKDFQLLQNLNLVNVKNQKTDSIISKLLLYKNAEILLDKRYDKIKIEKVKQSLRPFLNEEPIKLLVSILDNYGRNTTKLKNTLSEIQENNQMKAGNIDDLISQKKNSTLRIIEDLVFYDEIDLLKYPYLNKVIIELKSRKMKNVDADVEDLLNKL
jgi:hypothetical protein